MRTRVMLVPFALCAMGILSLFLAGCRKDEKVPEIPASSPASYMKDPEFRRQLDEQSAERKGLIKSRTAISEKMKAMVDAMRAKMPGADDAAVKVALEKDAEWNLLMKRVVDLNTALEENRKRSTKIVGDRLGAKRISK